VPQAKTKPAKPAPVINKVTAARSGAVPLSPKASAATINPSRALGVRKSLTEQLDALTASHSSVKADPSRTSHTDLKPTFRIKSDNLDDVFTSTSDRKPSSSKLAASVGVNSSISKTPNVVKREPKVYSFTDEDEDLPCLPYASAAPKSKASTAGSSSSAVKQERMPWTSDIKPRFGADLTPATSLAGTPLDVKPARSPGFDFVERMPAPVRYPSP
jgi:hypothetical protein